MHVCNSAPWFGGDPAECHYLQLCERVAALLSLAEGSQSAEERKIINYKDHHQVENQFCLHFWISHLMWMEYGTVLTANDAPPGSAWSSDLWNPLATGTSGGKWGNEMRKEFKFVTCCFCSGDKITKFWLNVQWCAEVYLASTFFKDMVASWVAQLPQSEKGCGVNLQFPVFRLCVLSMSVCVLALGDLVFWCSWSCIQLAFCWAIV